jgi:hypothetical protein
VTTLNNNNAETQQLRSQVGMDTMIAQREQNSYVVVASSLAPSNGGKSAVGLGERLNGPIAANACATTGRPTTGALTLGGADYLAGSVPLVDGSGACVGAVMALTPLSALRQTPLEYTVILAMAGALLTLITVAVGLMLHGRGANAGDPLHDERVRTAVAALAQAQADYATQMEQRDWVGRRLTTGRRHMQRLMTSLAADRVALQDATADIWAGVSHPGAPVDPAVAMRLAREGAVVAARIGSRLNDFDAVSSALFADLNAADEVDALLDETLAQTDATIAELRALTGAAAPDALAANAGERPAAPQDPFATHVLEAQRQRTGQAPVIAPANAARQTGGYRAVRPESAQHRAVGDRAGANQTPAPGQSQQGRTPGGFSGLHRPQWQDGSSARHSNANHPQAPRPPRRPPNGFGAPPDGRDRGSSGSRWLND